MQSRIYTHISYLPLLFLFLKTEAQHRIELQKDLSILLPTKFALLHPNKTDDQHSQKAAPLATYEHLEEHRTKWVFTLQNSPWREKDIQIMQSFLRANIEALYEGKVKWLQQRTQSIQGRDAVYTSFIGSRKPESTLYAQKASQDYHMLLSIVMEKKQLLIHFSCPARYYKKWQQDIKGAISSLRIP